MKRWMERVMMKREEQKALSVPERTSVGETSVPSLPNSTLMSPEGKCTSGRTLRGNTLTKMRVSDERDEKMPVVVCTDRVFEARGVIRLTSFV